MCVIPDHFPLPNILAKVSLFHGVKYFTTQDLSAAYHQIRLHQGSEDLATFFTPFGTYCYVHMPFGLVSAVAVFYLVMCHLFGTIQGINCFQYDILILGESLEVHEERVGQVCILKDLD